VPLNTPSVEHDQDSIPVRVAVCPHEEFLGRIPVEVGDFEGGVVEVTWMYVLGLFSPCPQIKLHQVAEEIRLVPNHGV